jgi:hypothetical protein
VITSLARFATIIALCLAIGLHWFVLQSVAWTAMIVKYSAGTSLSAALVKTFDGAHPCSLCRVVQKGKTSEKNSDLQPLASKFNLFVTAKESPFSIAGTAFRYNSTGVISLTRGESPPVPPPRLKLV